MISREVKKPRKEQYLIRPRNVVKLWKGRVLINANTKALYCRARKELVLFVAQQKNWEVERVGKYCHMKKKLGTISKKCLVKLYD